MIYGTYWLVLTSYWFLVLLFYFTLRKANEIIFKKREELKCPLCWTLHRLIATTYQSVQKKALVGQK